MSRSRVWVSQNLGGLSGKSIRVSRYKGSTMDAVYLYHLPRRSDHRIRARPEYLDGVKEAKFQKEIWHGAYYPDLLLIC